MSDLKHPDLENILKYIRNELEEEQEIALGEHFAECERCAETAAEYNRLRLFWDNWDAAVHGKVYWQEKVEKVLSVCSESIDETTLQERLSGWLKHWKGQVGGLIQFISGGAGEAARVLTRFPESLFPPGREYAFNHQAPVRGAGQKDPVIRVTSPGGIEVHWNRENKSVRIKIAETGGEPPAVVLLPAEGEPRVALPERIEGTAFFAVIFDDLESNECILFFEPSGSSC